jgi:hypothetical protein
MRGTDLVALVRSYLEDDEVALLPDEPDREPRLNTWCYGYPRGRSTWQRWWQPFTSSTSNSRSGGPSKRLRHLLCPVRRASGSAPLLADLSISGPASVPCAVPLDVRRGRGRRPGRRRPQPRSPSMDRAGNRRARRGLLPLTRTDRRPSLSRSRPSVEGTPTSALQRSSLLPADVDDGR